MRSPFRAFGQIVAVVRTDKRWFYGSWRMSKIYTLKINDKVQTFFMRTNDVNKERREKKRQSFFSCVYVADEFRFYRLFHLRFAIKSHSDSHRFILTSQLKVKCKRQIRIRINSRFFFLFKKLICTSLIQFAPHRAHLLVWLIRARARCLIVTGACSMSFTGFIPFRHIHFARRNLRT